MSWWKPKDLFLDLPFPEPLASRAFDGKTYEPERDHERLKGQLLRVSKLMSDGHWRTLPFIAQAIGGTTTGVSARLRDLRKAKYGAHVVERRHIRNGLFEYRVRP